MRLAAFFERHPTLVDDWIEAENYEGCANQAASLATGKWACWVKRILRRYGYSPDKAGEGDADGAETGGAAIGGIGISMGGASINRRRHA